MADSTDTAILKRLVKLNHQEDELVAERQAINQRLTGVRKQIRETMGEAEQAASGQRSLFNQEGDAKAAKDNVTEIAHARLGKRGPKKAKKDNKK